MSRPAQHGRMEKGPRRTAEREALIREIQRYLAVVDAFRANGRLAAAVRPNKGKERP